VFYSKSQDSDVQLDDIWKFDNSILFSDLIINNNFRLYRFSFLDLRWQCIKKWNDVWFSLDGRNDIPKWYSCCLRLWYYEQGLLHGKELSTHMYLRRVCENGGFICSLAIVDPHRFS
jgi:hypothetical protein